MREKHKIVYEIGITRTMNKVHVVRLESASKYDLLPTGTLQTRSVPGPVRPSPGQHFTTHMAQLWMELEWNHTSGLFPSPKVLQMPTFFSFFFYMSDQHLT
jgi:hypothetical protein